MSAVCCKHNRCPDRPTFWLRRFRNRPWYCPQCGRLWVTRLEQNWWDVSWVWVEVAPMTVPAHTNTTTAAAEVLVWHPSIQPDPNVMRWVCPTCGIDVGGGPNSPTHAQHQADMLAAAGLLADPTTRTEWGVRVRNGYVIPADDRLHAGELQDPGEVVVRRTVTDWTPAEEGPDD